VSDSIVVPVTEDAGRSIKEILFPERCSPQLMSNTTRRKLLLYSQLEQFVGTRRTVFLPQLLGFYVLNKLDL